MEVLLGLCSWFWPIEGFEHRARNGKSFGMCWCCWRKWRAQLRGETSCSCCWEETSALITCAMGTLLQWWKVMGEKREGECIEVVFFVTYCGDEHCSRRANERYSFPENTNDHKIYVIITLKSDSKARQTSKNCALSLSPLWFFLNIYFSLLFSLLFNFHEILINL